MAVDEKTIEALDLRKLSLPSSPPVSRIEVEDYEDSLGAPALRLLVVVRKNTDMSRVSGEAIGEVKAAIRENLAAHGIARFPYIFIATEEELAVPPEEE